MLWSKPNAVIFLGAAGGIGSAIVRNFANSGATVVATDIKFAEVQEIVKGLKGNFRI